MPKVYQTSVSKFSLSLTGLLIDIHISSHPEFEKLFQLTSVYTHARIIKDPKEAVFKALCCAFFERFLKKKNKDGSNAFS